MGAAVSSSRTMSSNHIGPAMSTIATSTYDHMSQTMTMDDDDDDNDETLIRDNHINRPLLDVTITIQKGIQDRRHELGKASWDFPAMLSRISDICIEFIKFSTIMHKSKAEGFFNDLHYLIKSYFDFVHTVLDFCTILSKQQHRTAWYNALAILCLCTDVNDTIGPAEFDIQDETEQGETKHIMKTIINEHQGAYLTHENAFTMFSMLLPTDEPTDSIAYVVPMRLGQCILVLLSMTPCYYVIYTQAELAVATVFIVTKKLIRYDTLARQAWAERSAKDHQKEEDGPYVNIFNNACIRAIRSIEANKGTNKECEALWTSAQKAATEIEQMLTKLVKLNEPQVCAVLKWFDGITTASNYDRQFIEELLLFT